jgi:hypothetical protein
VREELRSHSGSRVGSTHLTATTASKCASRSGDFEVLKLWPLRHQRAHKATQSKAQSCFEYLWVCAQIVSSGPANQSSPQIPKMVMHIRALPCWPNLSLVLQVQMHDERPCMKT